MKMKKESSKRSAKRHVVLTDRELATMHAGKKAKKASRSLIQASLGQVVSFEEIKWT
jgi:hypothetical protein